MSDKLKEIKDLLSVAGDSASGMTHSLKNIGDGDMKNGILNLFNFSKETGMREGMKAGRKQGAISGILGTLVTGIIVVTVKAVADKKKKEKEENEEYEQKGEKIIQGLKKGIEESKATPIETEDEEAPVKRKNNYERK